MANEYVSLKSVLHILDLVIPDKTIKRPGKAIRKRLKELPCEEIKHGAWLINEVETTECPILGGNIIVCRTPLSYRCSECGRVEEYQEPYCNCGAKMDLKEGAEE